jgi:hypothetical protein
MSDRHLAGGTSTGDATPISELSTHNRPTREVNSRRPWTMPLFAIPTVSYTLCYFLLTYPMVWKWSTSFYGDNGDGLQNEWNLWWIRKAVLQLHQSPWFTTWLHAPRGTTLIGHTLNPINGFVGIPLSFIFSPVHVYNLIVTCGFVFTGVTAFWLARHVCKSYVPALLGGFAFTFTGFHFAHSYGHMQLISLEFVPLFVLAWLRMLEKPATSRAISAGIVLGLVALCDFYLVFYCVLAGFLCGLYYFPHLKRLTQSPQTSPLRLTLGFGVFIAVTSICCGPLLIPLLIADARDPFDGAHNAVVFSSDAFSAIVPGGADLLGRFTKSYWSKLPGNISEQCVYVGLSVVAMAVYGAIKQFKTTRTTGCWIAMALSFYVLSLGPNLLVHGVAQTDRILPYAWLENLIPPLRLSGCPGRMMIMGALALSILMSLGIASFWQSGRIYKGLVAIFAVIMAIDLSPIKLPTTPVIYPAWTAVLRDLPLKGAVISQVDADGLQLYYQTLYDRPMAFGYISRKPQSVILFDRWIIQTARSGNFASLRRDMGFVYVVFPHGVKVPSLPIVYSDDAVNIQQLPDSGATKP